ncbi:7486_t:CDS:1 [Diversispora eburnea]|uniref:7486_t:CDS:1 n=1 Tax=Diversispora eburnea TaxID=1213867 RepID=A0A9N9B966_9GLOM|nr:7486_t:CDS:1 [Diversispora eburnea]
MPDVSHSEEISKTHVPTTFKWSSWGSNVKLAGSFDSPYTPWQPIQMKKVENSPYFEVTLDLQPNKTYDYKFVVDETNWVLDPDRPKFPDSTGYNENHQVYVEAPPPPSPMPKEPESPTIYEQEIEEFNLKDDEHEIQHDVKSEQQLIEQQSIADEVEKTIEEIEEQNIVNNVNEQEIVHEQEIEKHNIANEHNEQEIIHEQEIEKQNIVNEQETEEQNIVYEQEIEDQKIVCEQETEEQNIVEQEIEEQKIIYEQEIEKGLPNEISITAIKEATVEEADEINNITIEKEEIPIEAEEPVEKQEIIEEPFIEKVYVERKELKEDKEIIEKYQELSEESKTNVISNVFEETTLKADVSISLQTKTLENAIEEKSVDNGVESVIESSDIPHTDKITNSLQPSQIIKEEKTIVISEEIDTNKIIINETTSEIQVEEISETPLELDLPNESITETEVPSVTEVPLTKEISGDLIDKKVNEETTLPALDLTVTISNVTIDNANNTDNTTHKDEKVEPHESLPEMLVSNVILEKSEKVEKEFVSTSDLMTENIIVEKESIVCELEENSVKETETFKERNVISDTNEILSMSVEEIHKEYETVQEQTLPRVLEKTLEQSPSINSSILEVSEIPKESLTTTETNEVINNHDNLYNLDNDITEQKIEFVNVKNELDTYSDDSDTIVEENSNDVVSENLSSINIIKESTFTEFHEKSNDSLEENVDKSIPIQDEEISEVTYDDWEVQIAENNTTDITRKSVDGTQADKSSDHEPKIELINENEVHDIDNSPEPAFFTETQSKDEIGKSTWSKIKGLSVSTYEETISEEKLQEIDEINEVHAHMIDNKLEPERSLNSLTSYENEEKSPDHDENSHHDNPTKMDNEAFIIKDTETEIKHTENLTISYDNVNSVSEIQNNLSITQKDSMTEDIKLHEFESLGKITTENSLSDNLSDEAPGSSATACMTTTVSDDEKSDFYSIPNEMNTVEEIKPISKSTNGRKRGMTIFSPGESTKDANMVKSRHTKKNLKVSSSREVVMTKKFETQKYEDNDTKGNIFYLIASLVTTFTLGIISMLIKAVSGNNRR